MPNAVQYAETQLGVHEVWSQTQDWLKVHEAASDVLKALYPEIRQLKELLQSREADLTLELRAEYQELNTTDFGRLIKNAVAKDPESTGLRTKLNSLQSQQESAEVDRRHAETRLGVMQSRMEELGGLLHFYGAAKIESVTNKSSK